MKRLIRRRKAALCRGIGARKTEVDENVAGYNTLLEVEQMSSELGPEFVAWLLNPVQPHGLLFWLAETAAWCCCPAAALAGGTHPAASRWSISTKRTTSRSAAQCVSWVTSILNDTTH